MAQTKDLITMLTALRSIGTGSLNGGLSRVSAVLANLDRPVAPVRRMAFSLLHLSLSSWRRQCSNDPSSAHAWWVPTGQTAWSGAKSLRWAVKSCAHLLVEWLQPQPQWTEEGAHLVASEGADAFRPGRACPRMCWARNAALLGEELLRRLARLHVQWPQLMHQVVVSLLHPPLQTPCGVGGTPWSGSPPGRHPSAEIALEEGGLLGVGASSSSPSSPSVMASWSNSGSGAAGSHGERERDRDCDPEREEGRAVGVARAVAVSCCGPGCSRRSCVAAGSGGSDSAPSSGGGVGGSAASSAASLAALSAETAASPAAGVASGASSSPSANRARDCSSGATGCIWGSAGGIGPSAPLGSGSQQKWAPGGWLPAYAACCLCLHAQLLARRKA